MTTVPPVVYLAHPVRAPTADGVVLNLCNARSWLEHLVLNTNWAICAPWMPYVQVLDETMHRSRGLGDDLAILSRCDALALVGGLLTHGMQIERDHAQAMGLEVIDLLHFGFAPPADHSLYPPVKPRVLPWAVAG